MTGAWSLKLPGEGTYRFADDTGVFMRKFPELQQYPIADQDGNMQGVDGTLFGTDTHGGPIYAVSFGVVGGDEYETRDREDALKTMWRGDTVRRAPDVVGELVSDRGRSSFGRPRRIATAATRYDETPPQADVNAEWQAADPIWYGAQQSAQVGLVPNLTGGMKVPLKVPLSVHLNSSSRSTEFTVDSDIRTWPTIRVRGAIAGPGVQIIGPTGRRVQYTFPTVNLAANDWLDLTTVPWNRGVVRRSSGGSLPLGIGSSRFDQGYLETGTYELVLTGTSPTGEPRAFIEWRDAHSTP